MLGLAFIWSIFDWARLNGGEKHFTKNEQVNLMESSIELYGAFSEIENSSKKTSVFLFRIGYGKKVLVRTFRKNNSS